MSDAQGDVQCPMPRGNAQCLISGAMPNVQCPIPRGDARCPISDARGDARAATGCRCHLKMSPERGGDPECTRSTVLPSAPGAVLLPLFIFYHPPNSQPLPMHGVGRRHNRLGTFSRAPFAGHLLQAHWPLISQVSPPEIAVQSSAFPPPGCWSC